jgi:hypothetical protein
MKAKLNSVCHACKKPISLGETIVKESVGWVHLKCSVTGKEPKKKPRKRTGLSKEPGLSPEVSFSENARRVNSGETFRSRKPSTYRRGKSPGSYRDN